MSTKKCTKCKKEKELSEFHKSKPAKDKLQSWCKICQSGWAKTRDKRGNDNKYLQFIMKTFGVSPEVYKQMLSECNSLCMICKRPPRSKRLNMDHCHKTGKVRGLLCIHCNHYLATVEDVPEVLDRIKEYLQKE